MQIPCISMWQPWAQWVSWGWKTIESRTHQRFVSLAGRVIGIHCSNKWDENAIDTARAWLTPEQINSTRQYEKRRRNGQIIASVLVKEHRALLPADSPLALIDCAAIQRYGLILGPPKIITEPIKWRGGQGIFYADIREIYCHA